MRGNVAFFINIRILRGKNAECGWSVTSVWLACTQSTEICILKWQMVSLQATDFLRGAHGQPRTSKSPPVWEPLCFLKWEHLKWGRAGKNRVLDDAYGFAPGALLCQPYGVEEDTCSRSTAPFKYWKRILKKKKRSGVLHSGEEKLGTTNQVVRNHSGIAWDVCRVH